MWWGKDRRASASAGAGAASGGAASPRLGPSFSFKDVGTLLRGEDPAARKSPSSVFHRVRLASAVLRAFQPHPFLPPSPGAGDAKRVVIYFTSLRVVRHTFEDCRAVRSIFRGLRVAVDERDLSMDSAFLPELKLLLGRKAALSLPQVFVGNRYVGGADEIRQLHESGELRSLIDGVAVAAPGTCGNCGGARFVLCPSCSGSHKLFSDKGGGGFRACAGCNENGLVRCGQCVAG